jgi:GntR family transcriptional regulator, rspAB operon transcriptional repressor
VKGSPVLLRDNIYHAIREAILTCEYRPGQELREQILAERYRVSRSPIRDSLLRLERENLVTVMPRRGYQVRPISTSDVENLFGLHLLVEPACAAAAARANGAALQALDQFRGFADEDRDESSFTGHNKSFHRTVANLSGNMRMAAVALHLTEQLERLVRASVRVFNPEQVRDSCQQHDAIIDAIQVHDAESAGRLSYEHVAAAHARLALALRQVAAE